MKCRSPENSPRFVNNGHTQVGLSELGGGQGEAPRGSRWRVGTLWNPLGTFAEIQGGRGSPWVVFEHVWKPFEGAWKALECFGTPMDTPPENVWGALGSAGGFREALGASLDGVF